MMFFTSEGMMRRYYLIAKKDIATESPHSSECPKNIAYSYDGCFYLAEGRRQKAEGRRQRAWIFS